MFHIHFEVRDNEVDQQGIVNNANYFIYMAHTRHRYLNDIGINFADMAANNQNLLLTATQIDFKKPLYPNEAFYVTCEIAPRGRIRIDFHQKVYNSHNELCVKAVNTGVCVDGNNANKPYIPEPIRHILDQD